MKIAIYSRKSRLSDKGESIKNQVELCKEYANKHFYVDEFLIYEDDGFSGGSSNRPEYRRMISDAKKNNFNILMCYRLDRISRNIADFSDTIETLENNNISFISLREQFDTSTPMGRAMMYISSVFAQLERETIAERIKDNMLSLARLGRWLGGNLPIGYSSESIEYLDDNLNKKIMYKLKQIQSEIYIVKNIFNKYLELKSLNGVRLWSVNSNIKTPNNNYFDITSIRGVLTNMVYVKADRKIYDYCKSLNMDIASSAYEFDGVHGLMVYNKNMIRKGKANKLKPTCEWIVAIGKHEGIVSSTNFLKVQDIISKNKFKPTRKTSNNIALLSSFIVCSSCNSKLRTSYGNKRIDETRPHYYKCKLKEESKSGMCNISNINGTLADRLVLSEFKKLCFDFNVYHKYLKKQLKQVLFLKSVCKSKDTKSKIDKYQGMIKQLTINLSLCDSTSSSKYIIKQIEELDKKISKENQNYKSLISKTTFSSSELKYLESIKCLVHNFSDNINSLSFNEQKHLMSLLVEKIIWNGEFLEVYV